MEANNLPMVSISQILTFINRADFACTSISIMNLYLFHSTNSKVKEHSENLIEVKGKLTL